MIGRDFEGDRQESLATVRRQRHAGEGVDRTRHQVGVVERSLRAVLSDVPSGFHTLRHG